MLYSSSPENFLNLKKEKNLNLAYMRIESPRIVPLVSLLVLINNFDGLFFPALFSDSRAPALEREFLRLVWKVLPLFRTSPDKTIPPLVGSPLAAPKH